MNERWRNTQLKKFFNLKSKVAIIALVVLVMALVASTSAFAATTLTSKTVGGSFTVIEYIPNVTLYSDEACVTPLTTVAFGTTLHRGDVVTKTIYAKNTGEVDFGGMTVTTNLVATQGTIVGAVTDPVLTQGESTAITLTLTVAPTATYAVSSPSITIAGTSGS
jgi:methionine-rich copper-binding protein CopC